VKIFHQQLSEFVKKCQNKIIRGLYYVRNVVEIFYRIFSKCKGIGLIR